MQHTTNDIDAIQVRRFSPDQVPAELQALPAWLVWRFEQQPGDKKARKVPYYVTGKRRSGAQGSHDDRAQLSCFDEAVAAVSVGHFDGIGLAMLPEHGLTAVDLDDCILPDGSLPPAVNDAIEGTYAEYSPSGRGVRAFVRTVLPNGSAPAAGIGKAEFFSAGQFVTVTGNYLPGHDPLFIGIASPSPGALALHALCVAARQSRNGTDDALDILPSDITDKTIDELQSALRHLADRGHGNHYQEWHGIGQALKSLDRVGRAEDGLRLFVEYSAACEGYEGPDKATRKWQRDLKGERSHFRAVFAQAQALGWVNPRKADYSELIDRTDTGNANLLRQQTEGNLRYVPERKAWLWWDGKSWAVDDTGALAQREALRVAEFYLAKASDLDRQAADEALSDDERKRIGKAVKEVRAWAAHCRNRRAIEGMLVIASRDPRMMVHAADLDRDPWLFGVANGVVDLRTGQLRPAGRDDLVTKRATVPYVPGAPAARWCQFINEITGYPVPAKADPETGEVNPATVGRFNSRPDLARYVQLALGYSLTGSTVEQKMFLVIGEGSNGKNVLLDIVQGIAGDYWRTIPPEALMATRHDADAERPSPTAASLAGARAAISSESRDGQQLDVALVKRHTGGGFMVARLMRENSFRFEITHKLWLMTNHRPRLDHMDDAIRGRLHLVPFDRIWNRPGHPDRDPRLPDGDKTLVEALRAEGEGILAWLIEGAMAYHREGLNPPPSVLQMTRDYFADMDAVGQWLQTCQQCPPKEGPRTSELFSWFKNWCSAQGLKDNRSLKAFSMALSTRGIAKAEASDGAHFGIKPPLF